MASRSFSALDAAARLGLLAPLLRVLERTPLPARVQRRHRRHGRGRGRPAELPALGVQPEGDGYRELYGFLERFRALLSQASGESDTAAGGGAFLGMSSSEAAYLAATSERRDEFGRPYPYAYPHPHPHAFARPDGGRVRILNSYIRRMPTIESLGSRELAGTASASVAGSSVAGEHRTSASASASTSASTSATGHTLVRAPALAVEGRSEPPSRAGSLLCAEGGAEGGDREACDRERERALLRRAGSVGSSAGASYLSGSPMHTPIAEEPPCVDEDACEPPPPPPGSSILGQPPPARASTALGSPISGLSMPMLAPLRRYRADSV